MYGNKTECSFVYCKYWHLCMQRTGRLKQCTGAKTREQCNCSEDMMVTSDVAYSDCKRTVSITCQLSLLM